MGNNGELDVLGVLSIILGYSNLIENRQQSAHNDVEKHNREQEQHILADLHREFEKQNQLLYYQNNLLKRILNILERR